MKRPILIIGLLLLAAIAGLLLILRSRSLQRNSALLDDTTTPVTPTTTTPTILSIPPAPTPATPAPASVFTGETKYGYTDGQQIANHGTSYPVFARIVGGELYAVAINKTEGQALYNQPVMVSLAWLTSMGQFGANVTAFADKPHQQADTAPLSAFALTLATGATAIQPLGYSQPPGTVAPTVTPVPTTVVQTPIPAPTPVEPALPPVIETPAPVIEAPAPALIEPVPAPVVPVPPSVAPVPTETPVPSGTDDEGESLIPSFEQGLNG